ncbi:MAG: hypothetical protein FRX49_00772 [Trebouxia sp. A1-2]|nr:MAG: hypothetical protein FRX49_00772 [Trebouxia sp. A1-2]
MDTSFWDDDEERLHIVYQDDQLLPPVRTSTDNPGPATTAGRKFDLRGRFAEADLEAAAVVKKSEVDKPRRQADLKADHDKQLHHYASQALEAAAAYAERGGAVSPQFDAAATPQVARTGAADASSSHQPGRHHSFTNYYPGHNDPADILGSQAALASPYIPGKHHLLLTQAAGFQQGSQQTHSQGNTRHHQQTPVFHAKSGKKSHPLYTPAPLPRQKPAQQKKAKQRSGSGFAIRQPPQSAASASKPASTADAFRQLTGNLPNSVSASNVLPNPAPGASARHQVGPHSRHGLIAELLSDIQPNTHEDTIEEVEAQDQQPHLLSPSRQDNARSLLNSMLEGKPQHDIQRSLSQAPATTPWTPAVRQVSAHPTGHDSAATPSMTLQRQFIASLQDTPVAPASQFTASRSRAAPGSLAARLNRVLQLEKAQQAQFETAGSLGGQTMEVTITEHRLEGHVIKCRCCKDGNEAAQALDDAPRGMENEVFISSNS